MIVDISAPDARRAWEKARATLADAGWLASEIESGAAIDRMDGVGAPFKIALRETADARAVIADAYRMLAAMGATAIEEALAGSVPTGIAVDRVLIGHNWTMVRAGDLAGVARSPSRGTEGARTIRPEGGFAGCDLSALAAYLKSADPLSRSLGLAAVNAYWNRPDADYPELRSAGGLSAIDPPGEGVIIIGGFRGAAKRLPAARIVEREPRDGDIPADEAAPFFRNARTLVITAQTLMNASLEPLRRASEGGPRRLFVGPSAPLCPLLLGLGFHEVSAAVIQDADAAEAFVAESGTMIMLDHLARAAYLGRD